MRIDARRDVIDVKLGPSFGRPEAERIQDALAGLGAYSLLTIDLSEVRDCDDAALVRLAAVLRGGAAGQVVLRGLTHHQRRLLGYVGLAPEQPGPSPAA